MHVGGALEFSALPRFLLVLFVPGHMSQEVEERVDEQHEAEDQKDDKTPDLEQSNPDGAENRFHLGLLVGCSSFVEDLSHAVSISI
jgi:hypothetical protein